MQPQDSAASSASSQDEFLAQEALARCFSCGFGFIPPLRDPGHLLHVPFALLPRQLPRDPFLQAYALAPQFNALVDAVARTPKWLISTLHRTGLADPFTGRLIDIFEAVLEEGIRQPLYLGVHRSDYMIDIGNEEAGPRTPSLKQVELNTISAAFAGLSSRLADVHRYIVQRYCALPVVQQALPGVAEKASTLSGGDSLPRNNSLRGVVDAIAAAHTAYGVPAAVVAFVTQPAERNIMDQRLIEHELFERHGVRSVRLTLAELHEKAKMRDADGALLLPSEGHSVITSSADAGEHKTTLIDDAEVAVVYYRCGYTPDDYPTEAEWSARVLVERSRAIKCPPIAYHLVGTKKVQQALAMPGELEKFVSASDAAALRASFAGLWPLDPAETSPETERAIASARAHPERFVMKPQREGGGNNLYGKAIAAALDGGGDGTDDDGNSVRLTPDALAGFILMERIFPERSAARFVKAGRVSTVTAVSELGIYGVYLGDGTSTPPLLNDAVGHLLRTKAEDTDEGGVAAGFAVLDSPWLV